MKFGFTILHYLDAEVTEKCVRSLLAVIGDSDVSVIIVDNGSRNGSGEKLQSVFGSEPAVSVLILDSNLGFAGGNNAGYAFLKEKFRPDFIICANNDVIFTDRDFIQSVEKSFQEFDFDVMGPDIVDSDGQKHLNPVRTGAVTESEVRKSLRDIRLPHLIYRTAVLVPLWELYKSTVSKRKPGTGPDYTSANQDCILQGSCLVFSKKFIAAHNKAFCSKTFLYYEEYILKTVMDHQHGRMVYDPRTAIIHLGGCSTGKAVRNGRRKMLFRMNQYIRSWKAWLSVREELERGVDPLA